MNPSDVATEATERIGATDDNRIRTMANRLQPQLARHARSGNLAAASGVVSLVRAARTFLKGNRKRGLLRAVSGLFWVGVALTQRRSESGSSGSELSNVADTGPDLEGVETGERDADHATGDSVVNTTTADIEESDTAPEVQSDVDAENVDQRDVVGTDEVSEAESEADAAPDEAETKDESEAGSPTDD